LINLRNNLKSLEKSSKRLIFNTDRESKLEVQLFVILIQKVLRKLERSLILNFFQVQLWNWITFWQKKKDNKKELFLSIILKEMLILRNLSNNFLNLVRLKLILLWKLHQNLIKDLFKEELLHFKLSIFIFYLELKCLKLLHNITKFLILLAIL
jgi:hypothetical protein